MRHFDASNADCFVFTFKEGLLSALAHDLKLRVTRFEIDVDERSRTIEARFDPQSLRVVCAMRGGAEAPGSLSTSNKHEIERNIVGEVLEADEFPQITFGTASVEEKGGAYVVNGRLGLHGHTRQVMVRVHRQGKWFVGEARLHQPDFGIRPYSAVLGTLKVRPDVDVQVRVPAPPK